MFRGERPGETKLAPEWSLDRVAKHAIDFWLSTEDLPRAENRVTVDRDGNLTLAYEPTNDKPKEELYARLRSMLGKLDLNEGHLIKRFAYMKNEIPVAGVAHQAGTCRMGGVSGSSSSTATAKRMSSTTSTLQTRACSRASAQGTRRSPRWPTPCGSAIGSPSGWV